MLSFWEKQSFLYYDSIIIGSGIVGLSTAISLKEKYPNQTVLILESGIFPTGASTKNAGFACYGSAAEIWCDVQQLGWDKALEVVELRVKGLQKIRKRLTDNNLDYLEYGGGELILQGEDFDLNTLDELNRQLFVFFNRRVFEVQNHKPMELGFQVQNIRNYIQNAVEGQIDTGKMMKSLLSFAQQLDITIINGFHVEQFQKSHEYWHVEGKGGQVVFKTPNLYICTNAFTPSLLPELDIKPGRGQILITKPVPDLSFKGIFHFDQGYYYFRNFRNRVLFGGGRNLDLEGETTSAFAINPTIQAKLEEYLKTLILPLNTPFEIEHRWCGIMAFGLEKIPILLSRADGLKIGCRMNGMGVAMGTEIGEQLANMPRG